MVDRRRVLPLRPFPAPGHRTAWSPPAYSSAARRRRRGARLRMGPRHLVRGQRPSCHHPAEGGRIGASVALVDAPDSARRLRPGHRGRDAHTRSPSEPGSGRWPGLAIGVLRIVGLMTTPRFLWSTWSWDPLYTAPAFLLLWGVAANDRSPLARLLASPGMVLAGEASFAFCLLHLPLIGMLTIAGVDTAAGGGLHDRANVRHDPAGLDRGARRHRASGAALDRQDVRPSATFEGGRRRTLTCTRCRARTSLTGRPGPDLNATATGNARDQPRRAGSTVVGSRRPRPRRAVPSRVTSCLRRAPSSRRSWRLTRRMQTLVTRGTSSSSGTATPGLTWSRRMRVRSA